VHGANPHPSTVRIRKQGARWLAARKVSRGHKSFPDIVDKDLPPAHLDISPVNGVIDAVTEAATEGAIHAPHVSIAGFQP